MLEDSPCQDASARASAPSRRKACFFPSTAAVCMLVLQHSCVPECPVSMEFSDVVCQCSQQ